MSTPLYRKTLQRALLFTRAHPYVWFLGFLAAFLGTGGEYEYIVNQFNAISSGNWEITSSVAGVMGTGGTNMVRILGDLMSFAPEVDALVIGALAGVFATILWIVISAQGALIRAIALLSLGKKATLTEHFAAGSSSFWHVLGILLCTKIGALFILFVVGGPVAAMLMYVMSPIASVFLVLFVLGIPLFVLASLISKYAIAYRMIHNEYWDTSLIKSLTLFADHWLVSLELAFILFVVDIVFGAIIIFAVVLVTAPFAFLGAALTNMTDIWYAVGVTVVYVGRVLGYVLLLVLGSALATFQYATWTELFLAISKRPHLAKLIRVVSGWKKKYG